MKNKYWLAVKMLIYTGIGSAPFFSFCRSVFMTKDSFGTPFYATYWHL